MVNKIKVKAWTYGIGVILLVLALNFFVLSLLNFPIMATEIMKQYWYLIILLIGGFGLQVGLFVYYNSLNAISCSTTAVSGATSALSMILCCSHYLLNLLPFVGSIVGISALSALSKYTPYFLIFGIISNLVGIYVIFHQRTKYSHGGK